MTDSEILKMLHEYVVAKAQVKAINAQIVVAAVELGVPQEHMGKISCNDFLQGYLAAHKVYYKNPEN